jgi:DNA repair exonuclease SbcCD nuclease subunit
VTKTFKRLTDEALSRQVDLFVVAGDLFHSKDPGSSVVEFAVRELRKLGEEGITVVLAPGTHDHDGPGSVWRLVPFEELVPGLQLLAGQDFVERRLATLGVTLLARPNTTNASPESPLRDLSVRGREGWIVGVAHGSVTFGEVIGQGDFPIAPEEIASCGLSYLALGHWHKPTDYSQGGVSAWYSGSPEVLYPKDSGAGKALLVTLAGAETMVEPLTVGRCRAESITLRAEDHPEISSLREAILGKEDIDLMLEVKLTGLRPLGSHWTSESLEDLMEALAPYFYNLRLSDESHPRLNAYEVGRHSEATVAGRFVRIMAERLDQVEDETERRAVEEALQVGLALLEGCEEVLG